MIVCHNPPFEKQIKKYYPHPQSHPIGRNDSMSVVANYSKDLPTSSQPR